MKICVICLGDNLDDNFTLCMKNYEVHLFIWNDKNLLGKIKKINPDGIILSGSKYRILDRDIPTVSNKIFELGIPILGICFGYQTIVKHFGDKKCLKSYEDNLFRDIHIDLNKPFRLNHHKFRLNHHDDVIEVPNGFEKIEYKSDKNILHNSNEILGIYHEKKKIMGIIFHPESFHRYGKVFFDKWLEWCK